MVSPLGRAIEFLSDFGFFDVILPFLLIFTVVFGVLEKTAIFGKENGKPKKNINSMIAFVIAFFFIASKQLVQATNISLPQVAMVLIVIMSFMMLVGFFMSGEKEFSFAEHKGGMIFFTLIMFLGIMAIFLNAFGWLEPLIAYSSDETWQSFFTLAVLFAFIIGIILYVTRSVSSGSKP